MEGSPASDQGLRAFSYAVAEKAHLYVALVDALMDAKERFQLQLRPAEVAGHLPGASVADVSDALDALFGWGNVTRFYDPAAPETLDQFYAKRFLYQLTEAGVAAHEGIRAVRRVGLESGRLSGVLLPAIVEGLKAVDAEASRTVVDPARLYNLLLVLFASFGELADNAGRYMDALSVEIATITTDDTSFLSYKRAVFTYLDEFVGRLTEKVPEIAAAITVLEPRMGALVVVAASADEAPVREGENDAVRRSLADRWSGVRAWFLARNEDASIAELLRVAMLDAINRILAAVDRLHGRHLRRVSREADFTQLAHWFFVMGDDDAALLWDQAFGLYRPRHFAEVAGDEETERGQSFWGATPASVAPRLRASGTRAAPGRPGKAASYSAAKALGLAQVRATHRQAELAMGRLGCRSPVRLSDLGHLDPNEFAQLLGLIDAALAAAAGRDGVRSAWTALVAVTLRPLPERSAAVITTPTGTLRCDDCLLEIELAGRRVQPRAEAAG